jgi:hypothetical protein
MLLQSIVNVCPTTDTFYHSQDQRIPAADQDRIWRDEFGFAGARLIRTVVDESMQDYEYLKKFAIKPQPSPT